MDNIHINKIETEIYDILLENWYPRRIINKLWHKNNKNINNETKNKMLNLITNYLNINSTETNKNTDFQRPLACFNQCLGQHTVR